MYTLPFIIRIDHFHQMRSMIGPERAHDVQMQLFHVVRSACRSSDTVLRCRPDECGAILCVSLADNGPSLADRIQDRVRSHLFDAGDGLEFGLTCSIGFSAHPLLEKKPGLVTWDETVQLARHAVEVAAQCSQDAWVGYLGSDRPPPAALDLDRLARHPDSLIRDGFLTARTSFGMLRSLHTDRVDKGGWKGSRTIH